MIHHASRRPPLRAASLYLLFVNAATYLAFWQDKRAAIQQNWRISEATLLLLALLGGSLGAKLGQRNFRHKTRKEPFRTTPNLIVILHGVLIVGLCIPASRQWIFQTLSAPLN